MQPPVGSPYAGYESGAVTLVIPRARPGEAAEGRVLLRQRSVEATGQ